MTRMSTYFLPTEREPPADAEALSHKLMVRAGLIRQMGAGMWSWMPAGWRIHQRVVAIIREAHAGSAWAPTPAGAEAEVDAP